MPDITMCKDAKCPLAFQCWRYLAPPSERQSFFAGTVNNDDDCRHWWPTNSLIVNLYKRKKIFPHDLWSAKLNDTYTIRYDGKRTRNKWTALGPHRLGDFHSPEEAIHAIQAQMNLVVSTL